MVLFGICIRKDRDGIRLVITTRRWDKSICLKKYPEPESVKAPEMAYPSMLTKIPTGRIFDTEDIINGEPQVPKLIEPEDM